MAEGVMFSGVALVSGIGALMVSLVMGAVAVAMCGFSVKLLRF
jgi:hypothetical protein